MALDATVRRLFLRAREIFDDHDARMAFDAAMYRIMTARWNGFSEVNHDAGHYVYVGVLQVEGALDVSVRFSRLAEEGWPHDIQTEPVVVPWEEIRVMLVIAEAYPVAPVELMLAAFVDNDPRANADLARLARHMDWVD